MIYFKKSSIGKNVQQRDKNGAQGIFVFNFYMSCLIWYAIIRTNDQWIDYILAPG